jgi:outer membrane protein assembly factor BamB
MDGAAVAVAGRFYFAAPWWKVMALAAPGRMIWQTEDLNENVSAPLVLDDRGIIYACASRFLYALRPPGEPLPPAASPWPMFRANARHTGRVGK